MKMLTQQGDKNIFYVFAVGLCFFFITTLHLFHHLSLSLIMTSGVVGPQVVHQLVRGRARVQSPEQRPHEYGIAHEPQHLKKNSHVRQVNYVLLQKSQNDEMNAKDNINHDTINSDGHDRYKIQFPQSIFNGEWESINHPAFDLVSDLLLYEYEDGKEQQYGHHLIDVPKFWDPPFFEDGMSIRKFLGNYGEHLMTPNESLLVGSYVIPSRDYDEQRGKIIGEGEEEEEEEEEEEKEEGTSEDVQYIIVDQKLELDLPPNITEPLETIFVSIFSYRDSDACSQTITQLFLQAMYPERIRVAVVYQMDKQKGDDTKCSRPKDPCSVYPDDPLCRFEHLIDEFVMDANLTAGTGPIFARHVGNRMYRGEYFAMQIDVSMEFINNWDKHLVGQWRSTNNEMAVITSYVYNDDRYDETTGESVNDHTPKMCNTDFASGSSEDDALPMLVHGNQPSGPPDLDGKPVLQPQWAAGFSFSRGHFVVNVPYDQYLPMISVGEEISLELRGFTYGYDYYSPGQSIVFRKNKKNDKHDASFDSRVVVESKKRLLGIIEMLPTSNLEDGLAQREGKAKDEGRHGDEHNNKKSLSTEWYDVKQKEYGLGKVRTIKKFTDTFGINLSSRTVQHHMCRFVGAPMNGLFTPHLRNDRMGIDYDKITFQFQDPFIHGNTWERFATKETKKKSL